MKRTASEVNIGKFKYVNISKLTMAVKTITITEDVYNMLKSHKEANESFSKEIARIMKRRPLSDFFGVIPGRRGEEFERAIMERRAARNKLHQERIRRLFGESKEN